MLAELHLSAYNTCAFPTVTYIYIHTQVYILAVQLIHYHYHLCYYVITLMNADT